MSERNRSRLIFYGGMVAFLIVVYTGAAYQQAKFPDARPYEAATDLALVVIAAAFIIRAINAKRRRGPPPLPR